MKKFVFGTLMTIILGLGFTSGCVKIGKELSRITKKPVVVETSRPQQAKPKTPSDGAFLPDSKPSIPKEVHLNNGNEWEREVYAQIRTVREGLKGLGLVIHKDFAPLVTYEGAGFSFELPERMELKSKDRHHLIFIDRKRNFALDLFWIGFLPEHLNGKIIAGTDFLLLERFENMYTEPGRKARVFYETGLPKQFAVWHKETGPKIMVSKLGGWTEGKTGEVTFARFYLVKQGGAPMLGFAISWYSGTPESGNVFILVCLSGWKPVEITPKRVMWPSLERDPTSTLASLVLGSFQEGKD